MPGNAKVAYNLALAYEASGQYQHAERLLATLVKEVKEGREGEINRPYGVWRFYGTTLLRQGKWSKAMEWFKTSLDFRRGLTKPAGRPISMENGDVDKISLLKLRHDIEQIDYLKDYLKGSGGEEFVDLKARLETVKGLYEEAIKLHPPGIPESSILPLNDAQKELIGGVYNKLWYRPSLPRLEGPAIRELDIKAILERYRSTGHGVVVIDNLLTPEALSIVRRACLESTIWFELKQSYFKARFDDGLDHPVFSQITRELQAQLKELLEGHGLQELWAYKYSSSDGLGIHADAAAVNANIWITENNANLDPETGGLIVYHHAVAPIRHGYGDSYGWGGAFVKQQEKVLEESGYQNLTIPYKANRLVLFNSSLYHKTDTVKFQKPYSKRRINLTLLFGHAMGQQPSNGWIQFG